jgi:hypothetical protein
MDLHTFIQTSAGKSQPCPLGSRLRSAPLSPNQPRLFLPGAFFVTIGAQLLPPFMFIYFAFAAFF